MADRNGCGTNGNVWEWTSTLFDTHEGFEGTTIFPGYSSDFFDGKHHVVVRDRSIHARVGNSSLISAF
jgi:formylglycine-generating enzyme required for sulfatase activity